MNTQNSEPLNERALEIWKHYFGDAAFISIPGREPLVGREFCKYVGDSIDSEALALLDRLNNGCGHCRGRGLVRIYSASDEDGLPYNKPCDEDIHKLIEAERSRYADGN